MYKSLYVPTLKEVSKEVGYWREKKDTEEPPLPEGGFARGETMTGDEVGATGPAGGVGRTAMMTRRRAATKS